MLRKLLWMIEKTDEFFESLREERFRQPSLFLRYVRAIIAFFTPIVKYLGWESTDRTSTYQGQMRAWPITRLLAPPERGEGRFAPSRTPQPYRCQRTG